MNWDHAVSWGRGVWVSVSDIGRVGQPEFAQFCERSTAAKKTVGVYVPVREQFENRSAKQNQESREIAPWKPSAQHTPKPKTTEKQPAAQSHRTAVQQSTPTAKMAETPAALDSALEATTSADARVPSAAADTEIINVGSASSTDGGVGLSGGAFGQSLSPITEQTAVGPGCSRTFSKPFPGACLCVIPCFYVRSPCFARVCSRWYSMFRYLVIFRLFLKCPQQSTYYCRFESSLRAGVCIIRCMLCRISVQLLCKNLYDYSSILGERGFYANGI